jgi:hypothetical protein
MLDFLSHVTFKVLANRFYHEDGSIVHVVIKIAVILTGSPSEQAISTAMDIYAITFSF